MNKLSTLALAAGLVLSVVPTAMAQGGSQGAGGGASGGVSVETGNSGVTVETGAGADASSGGNTGGDDNGGNGNGPAEQAAGGLSIAAEQTSDNENANVPTPATDEGVTGTEDETESDNRPNTYGFLISNINASAQSGVSLEDQLAEIDGTATVEVVFVSDLEGNSDLPALNEALLRNTQQIVDFKAMLQSDAAADAEVRSAFETALADAGADAGKVFAVVVDADGVVTLFATK